MCHPLSLTQAKVDLEVGEDVIEITSHIKAKDRTGVEMKALTGVMVAALTGPQDCVDKVVREFDRSRKLVIDRLGEGYIRIAYSTSYEDLEEGLSRMRTALAKLCSQ